MYPAQFFYGESEFHIGFSQNSLPGVEKATFSQIRRKIMRICANCTVFYGECESEVGFAKILEKRANKLGPKLSS